MSTMSSSRKSVNPHCCVLGCKTKRPHAEIPATQEIIHFFSDPTKLTSCVRQCIGELIESVNDDLSKGRFFAYHTRTRQVEELYCRVLYVLLVADECALPHVFSGEPPNSFSEIWRTVNRVVFDDRGGLDTLKTDPSGENFNAMNMLNKSAHASFAAIAISIGIAHIPELQMEIIRHVNHWKKLYTYLDHMENMLRAGRPKSDVLVAARNLHKPASAWKARSAEMKN